MDRVRRPVSGDPTIGLRRHGCGDVRNDVQLVIEPPEVVEHVLHEFGVRLNVHLARIPRPWVLEDGEVQHLGTCQAVRRWRTAGTPACGRGEQAEDAQPETADGEFVDSQRAILPLWLKAVLAQVLPWP